MAFDDVTLFELHFDGLDFLPFGDDTEDVAIDVAGEEGEAESETADPSEGGSRGRRVAAVLAVLGAVAVTRVLLRRRSGAAPTPSAEAAEADVEVSEAAPDADAIAH